MARKSKIFFRIIVVLLLILYIAFAGPLLDSGTSYVQKWALKIENPSNAAAPQEGWIPFVLKDSFGYVSPGGDAFFSQPIQKGVEIGERSFCSYNKSGEELVIRNPFRDYMYPVDAQGYPFYKNGIYFILSVDSTGFLAVSENGKRLFSRRFSSLITSVDSGGDYVGVGLLNGTSHLFDLEGNSLGQTEAVDSRIDVIYGLAISPDGKMLALVHGIDPQIVSLYRINPQGMSRVHSETLRDSIRSQVILAFAEDSSQLIVESVDGVELLSTMEPYARELIELDGQLIDYQYAGKGRPLYLLTAEPGGKSRLSTFTSQGQLIHREEIEGSSERLYLGKKALYLSVEDSVIKIGLDEGM